MKLIADLQQQQLRKRIRALLKEAARNSEHGGCATYAQYDHFSAELRKLDLPPEIHARALRDLAEALGI